MASIIKADTLQSTTSNVFVLNSAGTEYARFHTTDGITFSNGGAERVRITNDGNVGIGTTGPSNFGGTNLQVANTNIASVVWTNGTYTGQLLASASAEVTIGSRSNHVLRFATNDTERMRIDTAGLLTLASGQIKFPATQNASADANTLDDYEEGTWTPIATSQGGSITSYTAAGTYIKIGRSVLLTMRVLLTNVGSASNALQISGLPFTSASVSSQMPIFAREGNVTGQTYQFFVNDSATTGTFQSLSGAGISWTNNYNYVLSSVYPSAS